jgi:elongation factor Ts
MLSLCKRAHRSAPVLYKSRCHIPITSTQIISPTTRANSTGAAAGKVKPTPVLVQQLRKETSCTIQKAIQALTESSNDYEQALVWLQSDKAAAGQKALQKLAGRVAGNGLIAISPLSNGRIGGVMQQVGNIGIPLRIGMVEVNCETDFVARSAVFEKLCRDLAWAIGFYADEGHRLPSVNAFSSPEGQKHVRSVDIQSIMEAPMLCEPSSSSPSTETQSNTVQGAIAQTIGLVGEKISLKRAAVISAPSFPLTLSSHSSQPTSCPDFIATALSVGIYAHNSTTPKGTSSTSGTIAAAALVRLRAPNLKDLILSSTETSKGGNEEWIAEYRQFERALARQIVGYPTLGIKSSAESAADVGEGGPLPLYSQAFDTYAAIAARIPRYQKLPLENVESALKGWGIASGMQDGEVEVLDYLKWTVGEE